MSPPDPQPRGTWLGVDIGGKRIGIARCDPTGTLASPVLVLQVKGRKTDIPAVAELAAREEAIGIVVGWPVRDDGVITEQTRKAERFATDLKRIVFIPVVLHDERFTTWEAEQRRPGATDADAAAVLLEDFLARRVAPKSSTY